MGSIPIRKPTPKVKVRIQLTAGTAEAAGPMYLGGFSGAVFRVSVGEIPYTPNQDSMESNWAFFFQYSSSVRLAMVFFHRICERKHKCYTP